MDARPAPSPDRTRSLLPWFVQGGLLLAAVLLAWYFRGYGGLWHESASTWTQNAPLVGPPSLPSLDGDDPALPAVEPDAISRLYLPAFSAGPAAEAFVESPSARPDVVAENRPASRSVAPIPAPPPSGVPTSGPPLQLPEPWLDVPRSTVLARSSGRAVPAPPDESQGSMASAADVAPAPADQTPFPLAAGANALALSAEAASGDTLSGDGLPGDALLGGGVPADQTSRWIWPAVGEISQFFSDSHRAIDIVTEQGQLVVTADGGEVVYASWDSSGFGYLVVVDHGDGYQTYYGHLYGFYVVVGQVVERGDLVGQIGNTGNSTGPHLHFEIRHLGVSRDPLSLLPPG